MSAIVWLHDDALRHWYADLPAVYVFDPVKLEQEQWGLKRVGFVYECLLELPVEIRRGDPVVQVLSFQQKCGADRILVTDTPDPRLREQIKKLQASTTVEMQHAEAFADISSKLDLKRFSKYWSKAEKALRTKDNQTS